MTKYNHQAAGFEAGGHWISCDMCAREIRFRDCRRNWEGLLVCPDDWEARHPQDFVRGGDDDASTRGEPRPPQDDTFTDTRVAGGIPRTGDDIPIPTFGPSIGEDT